MTGLHIVRNEGIVGLYRGLNPAVVRGLFYGGESDALYAPLCISHCQLVYRSREWCWSRIMLLGCANGIQACTMCASHIDD